MRMHTVPFLLAAVLGAGVAVPLTAEEPENAATQAQSTPMLATEAAVIADATKRLSPQNKQVKIKSKINGQDVDIVLTLNDDGSVSWLGSDAGGQPVISGLIQGFANGNLVVSVSGSTTLMVVQTNSNGTVTVVPTKSSLAAVTAGNGGRSSVAASNLKIASIVQPAAPGSEALGNITYTVVDLTTQSPIPQVVQQTLTVIQADVSPF